MANSGPEWLVEEGIGESRALLIDKGEVIAAKLRWPDGLSVGTVITAKLTSRKAGSTRGVGQTDTDIEILLDGLPTDASEGSEIPVLVTREPMSERGRFKRATGRYWADDAPPSNHLTLDNAQQVQRFEAGLWEEVWDTASEGQMDFAGGNLTLSPTPAMTLIDIDGTGTPRDLSLAAVPAIARAIRWLDLGGSIGIDFPTIEAKKDRKAVDEALAVALDDYPHERTAMNGFGFVQIVARLEAPSLLHRLALSRTGAAARMLLRRAEMVTEPGAILLTCHPAIKAHLKSEWLAEAAKRTGREMRIETDPALALTGGFAQAVAL